MNAGARWDCKFEADTRIRVADLKTETKPMTRPFRNLIMTMALCAAITGNAAADTVVLVQGYLGSAASWRLSGIGPLLDRSGWRDGGHLSLQPGGVIETGPGQTLDRRFLTIDLMTEAPIGLQAEALAAYVAHIRARRPNERVFIVGHSAGGVVGRLFMVRQPQSGIAGLVTIASPNLGSGWAELANFVGSTPAAFMAPFFGMGTLNRSQALYRDLSREHPNNLLGWLNRQPHPIAAYVAVVRVSDVGRPVAGDTLVDGPAQDLNTVPALAGRAETILSPGDHGLRPHDGVLLSTILDRIAAGS